MCRYSRRPIIVGHVLSLSLSVVYFCLCLLVYFLSQRWTSLSQHPPILDWFLFFLLLYLASLDDTHSRSLTAVFKDMQSTYVFLSEMIRFTREREKTTTEKIDIYSTNNFNDVLHFRVQPRKKRNTHTREEQSMALACLFTCLHIMGDWLVREGISLLSPSQAKKNSLHIRYCCRFLKLISRVHRRLFFDIGEYSLIILVIVLSGESTIGCHGRWWWWKENSFCLSLDEDKHKASRNIF